MTFRQGSEKEERKMVRDLVEKVLFYRDGPKTFFKPEEFPWVASIEAEWKTIRKELDAGMVPRQSIRHFQDASKHDQTSAKYDEWETIMCQSIGISNENKEKF